MTGIEKVNLWIEEMERTMRQYREFGAEDTEPDQQLQGAMIIALEHGVIQRPSTADGWELFTASMDCREAGEALTRVAGSLCQAIKDHRHEDEVRQRVRDYCWRV
jgi:hypothetical protein